MNVTAVVLAAGRGQRVGSDIPKQFMSLAGLPMLHHSLRVFEASGRIGAIVVALPERYDAGPDLSAFSKVAVSVPGGGTRQDSLARAMARLPDPTDAVLVHDAARPLLEMRLLDAILDGLVAGCDGVIPAVELEDTIKRVTPEGMVEAELDRAGIWRVQTPQLFRRLALEDSLRRGQQEGLQSTDCSQMLTRAGYAVRVVEADSLNFKVTRAADLWLAEQIMAARQASR